MDRRGRGGDRRPYPELLESLEASGRRFAAQGVGSSERVVVSLHNSWDWLECWFGVLLAGGWPVAMAPPGSLGSPTTQVERVYRVAELLGARSVVASPSFQAEARRLGLDNGGVPTWTPDEVRSRPRASSLPRATVDPQAVAFLQLTSGSTGLPRAVEIPHRAVIHNVLASSEAIGVPHGSPTHEWAESMVAWLPLYHDMGLVGTVVYSLVNGLDLQLLSPRTFLARPWLWLEILGSSGVALSPAPNFSYQLAVERTPQDRRGKLDLGGWKAAMVGAEMVRPDTMDAFCGAFSCAGFASPAVRPCYGLAEATLAVTFDCKGQGARTQPIPEGADPGLDLRAVTCNGVPVRDTQVQIADPRGQALPEDRVGEVWIRGPGVMNGYFNDPGATAEAFCGDWYRSGDLGFLHGGELYLTGRSKEILIVRGQNLMPHELEWIAEGTAGSGGRERCGAFSVARGSVGEEPVLVMEAPSREPHVLRALEHEVRSRVGRALSLVLADVVFVRRGRIPKTTSGKVRRRELRRQYLEGELERVETD